jgi:hypothetical protein
MAPFRKGFGAAMSSSPWEWLGNGDEDVASPLHAGAVSTCAPEPAPGRKDPAPQDVARLDKAADLIEADYRVLVSNTSRSAMGPRNLICNLPDLMERILKEV